MFHVVPAKAKRDGRTGRQTDEHWQSIPYVVPCFAGATKTKVLHIKSKKQFYCEYKMLQITVNHLLFGNVLFSQHMQGQSKVGNMYKTPQTCLLEVFYTYYRRYKSRSLTNIKRRGSLPSRWFIVVYLYCIEIVKSKTNLGYQTHVKPLANLRFYRIFINFGMNSCLSTIAVYKRV